MIRGLLTLPIVRTSTMPEPTLCCRACDEYCGRCDVLVGLDGLHVVAVDTDVGTGALTVTVESEPGVIGCHTCGVVAHGPVSYTHLRAHETKANLVCRLLLEKKK